MKTINVRLQIKTVSLCTNM